MLYKQRLPNHRKAPFALLANRKLYVLLILKDAPTRRHFVEVAAVQINAAATLSQSLRIPNAEVEGLGRLVSPFTHLASLVQ